MINQDMAQSYGYTENLSIIIVRFFFDIDQRCAARSGDAFTAAPNNMMMTLPPSSAIMQQLFSVNHADTMNAVRRGDRSFGDGRI